MQAFKKPRSTSSSHESGTSALEHGREPDPSMGGAGSDRTGSAVDDQARRIRPREVPPVGLCRHGNPARSRGSDARTESRSANASGTGHPQDRQDPRSRNRQRLCDRAAVETWRAGGEHRRDRRVRSSARANLRGM